ncbi:MAG TPA: SDR family oxidoreductase [Streptosporangiaceae bacterium]|jgi:NAD(P)-dependent dehydrogenase (short-subunit alcohol dehydrogenase family)|nr:SDR family oxidoreductase [Streptosporangiaceae bacterium]
MPTALITGGSKGLGLAVTHALVERGWSLVVDARRAGELAVATAGLPRVVAIPGDVTDPVHRAELAAAVSRLGPLDLLVNNASTLGVSPLPQLADYPLDELRLVFETNVIAPLALFQSLAVPLTAAGGVIVNVSSDAAVESYPGWGGYGSAKAALDQLSTVLAAEEPRLRCYAFDPGDMRTEMHQLAFPGEDISDRPDPVTAVPALLRLLDERPASGRYRAADLLAVTR